MNGLDASAPAADRHGDQAAERRARAAQRRDARARRRPSCRRPTRSRRRAQSAPPTSSPCASLHGVSPSLAAAIAWQESGFNNAMVSAANARGVMQVMPGTWSYVQDNLADRALDPNSATDNVHAGVLYLKRLLADTGGDESAAIAGYYQGLASVPLARHVRRHQAVRRQRAGAARRFGGLARPLQAGYHRPSRYAGAGVASSRRARAPSATPEARLSASGGTARRSAHRAEQQREHGAERDAC